MNRRTILLVGIVALGLTFGAAGALALNNQSGQDTPPAPRGTVDAPALPRQNRWIQYGEFFVEPWDNRALLPEAKAKTPWYDPRWRVFNGCLEGQNVFIRTDRTKPFSQSDIDELVKQVNGARPDRNANRLIGTGDKVSGIAGVFLECADRWLSKDPSQYAAEGVRELQPGEVPEP